MEQDNTEDMSIDELFDAIDKEYEEGMSKAEEDIRKQRVPAVRKTTDPSEVKQGPNDMVPISDIPGKEDTIPEERAHAEKNFNKMLAGTADPDPSDGFKIDRDNAETAEFSVHDGTTEEIPNVIDEPGEPVIDETSVSTQDIEKTNLNDADKQPAIVNDGLPSTEVKELKPDMPKVEEIAEEPSEEATEDESSGLMPKIPVVHGDSKSLVGSEVQAAEQANDGEKRASTLVSDKNMKDIDWKQKGKDLQGRMENAGKILQQHKTHYAQPVSFETPASPQYNLDAISDERMKELFKNDDDLACLAKIHSYDFKYKPEAQEAFGGKDLGVDNEMHHGVIAQELQDNPNYKGVVTVMPDGTLALKTKELSAANTANIGDLARVLEDLTARLSKLENVIGDRD